MFFRLFLTLNDIFDEQTSKTSDEYVFTNVNIFDALCVSQIYLCVGETNEEK